MSWNQGANHISTGNEIDERTLVDAAWLEWRTRIASTTDDPDERSPTPGPDSYPVDPPRWFRFEEIGLAIEHGPSLRWTCSQLARTNERAVRQLGREAPYRVSLPVGFVDPRKRKTRDSRVRPSPPPRATAGDARGESLSLQIDREFAALKARYAA